MYKNFSDLNGIYKDIAENISYDVAIKFHEHYKGLQVTFPVRLMSRDYIVTKVRAEYNGQNLKYLCHKYGYSERGMRNLLRQSSEKAIINNFDNKHPKNIE